MQVPELIPVDSTAVKAVGYSVRILWVEYQGGHLYMYDGVPLELHAQLMRADSKGKFVNEHVKPYFDGVEVLVR